MAFNDVRLSDEDGGKIATRTWRTEAGSTPIFAGEPVKQKAFDDFYVIPLATGDPFLGGTTPVFGIAKSSSTHTATEDGTIEVFLPDPTILYSARATDPTSVDTQDKIDMMLGRHVVFDLTGGVYTVDTNMFGSTRFQLIIVGGDPVHSMVYFYIEITASILGWNT